MRAREGSTSAGVLLHTEARRPRKSGPFQAGHAVKSCRPDRCQYRVIGPPDGCTATQRLHSQQKRERPLLRMTREQSTMPGPFQSAPPEQHLRRLRRRAVPLALRDLKKVKACPFVPCQMLAASFRFLDVAWPRISLHANTTGRRKRASGHQLTVAAPLNRLVSAVGRKFEGSCAMRLCST